VGSSSHHKEEEESHSINLEVSQLCYALPKVGIGRRHPATKEEVDARDTKMDSWELSNGERGRDGRLSIDWLESLRLVS
jgi:hypothetical protein